MKKLIGNSKGISKVIFAGVVIVLLIALIALGFVMSNTIDSLQTEKTSLQSQITSLQSSNTQLQTNYNNLQSQYNQLNTSDNNLKASFAQLTSEYQQLQSTYQSSQTSQMANLQSQIASLQSQLSNATALIAQLRGPTGILPTYTDLGYVGGYGGYGGAYFLQLSLKSTENVPITQIFVTLNSVQITMTFAYLNTTVSLNSPLPPYQTATASQNVQSLNLSPSTTYPLIIQAVATNGTIYTYQTTITTHV